MEIKLLDSNLAALIAPYGGKLVDLTVPVEAVDELKAYTSRLPSVKISPRSVSDLEMLSIGAFSPLDRFMGQEDYRRVLDEMRLCNGQIFPIPITLPVDANHDLHLDQDIVVRNSENELLGIMTIQEIYEWDRNELSNKLFGSFDLSHPLVSELQSWGKLNVSGKLQILNLPRHFDFTDSRLTPNQTRPKLAGFGRQNVVAYQPQSKLDWIDEEELMRVLEATDSIFLLQPRVGLTKLGDVEHYLQIRFYQEWIEQRFKPDQALLSLLPLATRLAGMREILWQALIHRNYGANQLMVSRSPAGPAHFWGRIPNSNSNGDPILLEKLSQELGVSLINVQEHPINSSAVTKVSSNSSISPKKPGLRTYNKGSMRLGKKYISNVAQQVTETTPPRHRLGVCIWFTGLSGAGKSTIAKLLTWLLLDHGRKVTVLDGDVVRTSLSSDLGFSKEDRDTNVRRIGYVASDLVRLGGMVICSVVSPYMVARNDVRNMVGKDQFVEVFVNTPLKVCESRDVKGLYARVRRGEITGFTGIDDPYEPPLNPEITLDTVKFTLQQNVNFTIKYLLDRGFIVP